MKQELLATLARKEGRLIEVRRYLHQHPELSFHEEETARYIAAFYAGKDCVVETGVGGGNGVVVTIDSGQPGKTLGIRADFDALPVAEETGLDFASTNPGVMHACGHDVHTAYLLILAETLLELKSEFTGRVKVFHQPGEELVPGGAQPMIAAGCLDGVDHVVGLHVVSFLDTGVVGFCPGPAMLGNDDFIVKIQGKGGHGSMPHLANDAIVAASYFVTALQTIVSRRVNPFDLGSVTIGSFDGKGKSNIIKDSVILEGDVRYVTAQTRATLEREVRRILDGLASAFGITYELTYEYGYPMLANDPGFTNFAMRAIQDAHIERAERVERIPQQSGSEDFSYFLQERPGTFYFVGGKPRGGELFPNHHPRFDVAEEVILTCAQTMGAIATDYLAPQT